MFKGKHIKTCLKQNPEYTIKPVFKNQLRESQNIKTVLNRALNIQSNPKTNQWSVKTWCLNTGGLILLVQFIYM